ncbi:hypothetical protein TOTORO_00810 [Serratia phage vB_SmaS-Totoro]|nr:hypothetical protein TOTORO_00810 [Serratia phage vB_SmaS-Totoro]
MFTKAKSFIRSLTRRIKAEDVAVLNVEIVAEADAEKAIKAVKSQRRNSVIVSHLANAAVSFVFGFTFTWLLLTFPEIFLLICAIFCFIKAIDVISNFFVARITRANENFNSSIAAAIVLFGAEVVNNTLNPKAKKKAAKAESSQEVMTGDDAEPVLA